MMNDKTVIAVQMYTLRHLTQTAEGIENCFRRLSEMGWKAVQMSAWGDVPDQQVRDLADRYGLLIPATHIGYDKLIHDTDAVIAQHKVFGAPYVGLGMMPGKFMGSVEGYEAFVDSIEPAAKAIRDAGLKFIYHNHNCEFERFGDRTGMDILMERTDPDWFQFEMDTYWVAAGGGDPAEWIQKLNGRMDVVHFKDMVYNVQGGEYRATPANAIFAAIGEGNLNWKRIIPACAEIRAKWMIVEQDECTRDPFDCLESSLHFLNKMGLR